MRQRKITRWQKQDCHFQSNDLPSRVHPHTNRICTIACDWGKNTNRFLSHQVGIRVKLQRHTLEQMETLIVLEIKGPIIVAEPFNACSPITMDLHNTIALAIRDKSVENCTFVSKVIHVCSFFCVNCSCKRQAPSESSWWTRSRFAMRAICSPWWTMQQPFPRRLLFRIYMSV